MDFIFGDNTLACGRTDKYALLRGRERLLFHEAIVLDRNKYFCFFRFQPCRLAVFAQVGIAGRFIRFDKFLFGGLACLGKDG